jgi:hypothetical protein
VCAPRAVAVHLGAAERGGTHACAVVRSGEIERRGGVLEHGGHLSSKYWWDPFDGKELRRRGRPAMH